MSSSQNSFHIDRLVGRDNYVSWKFAVQAYFELEDLWSCVIGTNMDVNKEIKAKSKLILLLDPINYVHVQSAVTCKDVWESLEQIFDDSGLYRRVALLRDLITTTLESSRSVDDYVNKIMTTAHKLRNIKFDVNDEWLGTLMLAGLPETYKPMIMGLESSGIKIGADTIKTKLLQEVQCSESSAFLIKKKIFHGNYENQKIVHGNCGNQKKIAHVNYGNQKRTVQRNYENQNKVCYNCNKRGHIARDCRVPKRNFDKVEEKKSFAAAFSTSQSINSDLWYVDSGASMHMTNRCDWMYDIRSSPIPTITVASKTPLPVENMGKVNLLMNGSKASRIQVRDVLYSVSI